MSDGVVCERERVFFSSNLIYAIVIVNCVICYFDIFPEIKTKKEKRKTTPVSPTYDDILYFMTTMRQQQAITYDDTRIILQ